MSNIMFPASTFRGLTWDVLLSPMFNTEVQQALSGREVRNAYMADPIWKLNLHFEVLPADPNSPGDDGQTDFDRLLGFFLQRQGAFDDFLLRLSDVTHRDADSIFSNQPTSPSVTDGVNKSFQLMRQVGGNQYGTLQETVQNPQGQLPVVYLNGVAQSPSLWTCSKGLVTFASAPSAGKNVTADFVHLYRVRFDPSGTGGNKSDLNEGLDFSNLYYLLWECQDVPLISVKI